jgi:hypothetical protein
MGWIFRKLAAFWRWAVVTDQCPGCRKSLSEGDHDDCLKDWAIR